MPDPHTAATAAPSLADALRESLIEAKARASERERIRELAQRTGYVNGVNVSRVINDLLDGDDNAR